MPDLLQVACLVSYITAIALWVCAEWLNYKRSHAKCVHPLACLDMAVGCSCQFVVRLVC